MTINQVLLIIDRAREEKGMTIEELNAKAGLGRTTYKQWMRGLYKPQMQTVMLAADAVGLEIVVRRKNDENHDNGLRG